MTSSKQHTDAMRDNFLGYLLSGDRQNGKVLTSVIDQGVGIKASELPLIFQPFQKSSSRPTTGEGSTGLGLVITKKIVEEHGGNIEVRSEERKGSCFRFDIPVSHMNSQ